MKKIVSLLLVFCMVLSLTVTAFAKAECDCGHVPVIYVVGMGDTIYDYEGEEPVTIFAPNEAAVKQSIPSIVIAVLGLLTHQHRLFATFAMKAAYIMLGRAVCDPNGDPRYDTGVEREPLPDKDTHGQFKEDKGDYVFHYDWRLDPLDTAKQLRKFVLHIEKLTKHSTVSFTCHSMGNIILASYLYLYGSDNIEKIVCMSPAFQGLSIMGSLLSGEADISGKGKEVEMFLLSFMGDSEQDQKLKTLVRVCYKLGLVSGLLNCVLQPALTHQFERVFDECLREMFAYMPGVWAFVPNEYYERAKAYTFGDSTEYTKLIERIDDYHYNVEARLPEILQEAMDNGVGLAILSGYGISSIPLSITHTNQADFVIDTKYTSIGATCAPFGETLPQSHIQSVRDGHDHISPDFVIDASTCAFPEYTWFVRDQIHFDFPDNYIAFVRWLLDFNGQPTVHSSAQYPQFLCQDGAETLTALTK